MSNEFNWQDRLAASGDLLGQSSPAIMKQALEYARLAALPHPTEAEKNQLGQILEQAVEDEIISFWIAEIDHLLGHHLGLLDESARETYRDQQAFLIDYAGKGYLNTETDLQIDPSLWEEKLRKH